jgi:hypothetical protein
VGAQSSGSRAAQAKQKPALGRTRRLELVRIVAFAMVHGPRTARDRLADADPSLAGHHRTQRRRSDLLELAGDREAAGSHNEFAAARR